MPIFRLRIIKKKYQRSRNVIYIKPETIISLINANLLDKRKIVTKRERVTKTRIRIFVRRAKAIRCWPIQSKDCSRVNRRLCMGITFCARQSKRRVRSKLDEDKPSLNSSHFQMHLGHGVFASRTRISRVRERERESSIEYRMSDRLLAFTLAKFFFDKISS